ncbi:MAG: fused MFS/spermidine synthase [Sphingobium sp.]
MAEGGSARRFVLAICAGSFLLFLVQPMVARMALPRLGGAPSVWNSAMLVYQALLLAGYGYAHALGRLAPRRQATVHALLFLLAALALPIGLFAGDPPAVISPALWVLWLIGGSIGSLFFVVAAQAPLLQRWFTLTSDRDPYPLYAPSNLGSFAGLLAYPLLVEPFMPIRAQSLLWSAGYALLFLLVGWCAIRLPRHEAAPAARASLDTPRPAARTKLHWLALSAVPSGLLLSTSLHLTTDIVAMPLLWVLPLGIYLLSFTFAFSEKRALPAALAAVAPLLLLMAGATAFIDATDFPMIVAVVTLLVLFVVAVALHGRLYDLRPAPAHLTLFYLIMSVGGMLGGLFCALLAPLVFDWTYEHPLLLVAAALLLTRAPLFGRAARWLDRGPWIAAVLLVAGLLLSLLGEGVLVPAGKSNGVKAACFVAIIGMAVLTIGRRFLFAAMLAYLMLCLGGWSRLALSTVPGAMTRSYFGVYMVRDNGPSQHVLVHGTTVHGIQNRAKGRETDPTSYYAPLSGVGIAMRHAPALFGPGARIGVVGLGAGTLACYKAAGQRWRFYEIDPAMARIARDPKAFQFLARCQPDADIAIGDARIKLAREPAHAMDLLVIDAFSSDSIPMHLLTREALALYRRKLSPRGLLLIHISNRFIDLRPVLASAAKADGLAAALRHYRPDRRDADRNYAASMWVALSPDPAQLQRLVASERNAAWEPIDAPQGFRPWSDDYGSILPVLKF